MGWMDGAEDVTPDWMEGSEDITEDIQGEASQQGTSSVEGGLIEDEKAPQESGSFLDGFNSSLRSITPKIPIVSEGIDMIKDYGTSLVTDQTFDEARDSRRVQQDQDREDNPISSVIGDVAGGAMVPGGIIAGIGANVADTALKTDGDLESMGMTAAVDTVMGGVMKGAGAGAGKLANSAKNRLTKFMNPTAKQIGSRSYKKNQQQLIDEVLSKDARPEISRDELRDLVRDRREFIGKNLQKLRKKKTSLTRKELADSLEHQAKLRNVGMAKGKEAEFRSASKSALTKEYYELKSLASKSNQLSIDTRKELDLLESSITSAKADAASISIDSPAGQKSFSEAASKVEVLEKKLASKVNEFSENASKYDDLSERMSKIEQEPVTLDQLYQQKLNAKNSKLAADKGPEVDDSDLADSQNYFRNLEDAEGGKAMKSMKKDYGTYKDIENITESAPGKYLKNKENGGIGTYVPNTVVNKSLKVINKFLPEQKDVLKLSGFDPNGFVSKNSKWLNAFSSAIDRKGGAGVSVAHKILMSRDQKYREAYKKEQQKKREEGE